MTHKLLYTISMIFETVVGGLSGILLAAIILNEIQPGHPFYIGIQSFLRGIF